MIRNYIKIVWRTMLRNKGYTFINVIGLTIGITCACLLLLYIQDELNFDHFHRKSDRTFRVVEIDDSQEPQRKYGITAAPLGPALLEEFPQVVNYTRLLQFGGHINFLMNDTRYAERNYALADSTFFEVFDYDLIRGDRSTVLKELKSVVLSESTAKKYFGDEDPIGKLMKEVNFGEYRVTGIMRDFPTNSHLDIDLVLSHFTSDEQFMSMANSWDDHMAYTYVVLDQAINLPAVNANIPSFIERHWSPDANRNFYLQPLEDIYFGSQDIEYGAESRSGQLFYIYVFGGIALFILLIAGVNYMNLTTAKSSSRAMEIGLRKSSGAKRSQLIIQFLGESLGIAILAFALSVGLVDLLLPYFNLMTGKEFEITKGSLGSILSLLFGLSMLIGLIAGSYPAIVLSGYKPSVVLKGDPAIQAKNPWLRKILVIGQFTISTVMIVSMLVIGDQMKHISNRNIGFTKDNIVVVDINSGNVRRSFRAMKSELLKVPGVVDVASSSRVPGDWKGLRQISAMALDQTPDTLDTYFMGFDEDVVRLFDMNLVEGRNFEGIEANDSTKILLNESAVADLGLDDPVGKQIRIVGMKNPLTVIGVIKNFHFQSLYEEVRPLLIGYWYHPIQAIDYFSIKVRGNNIDETIEGITAVHEIFDKVTPIEYHFLDSQIEMFYENDRRAGKIFLIGSFLTILISCMGLFGLASFTMQKRLKEISLRKVMGASTSSLFILLIKSFAFQIIMSILIASPIAFLLMDNWLESFSYRISVGPLPFVIAALLSLIAAISTVSYSCFRAVMMNPADTLKHQ